MSTYVKLGLESLDNRLREIDLILEEAKSIFEKKQSLYDALCRSAQVLLLAHFEGYLKDLVRDTLDDINYHSSFKQSHKSLKRTFCENFLKLDESGKTNEGKLKELLDTFDSLDTKFKKEYFLYSNNKNPKATVLDNIASRFGMPNFFSLIKRSKLDSVFSNTHAENVILRNEIRDKINSWTNKYPYSIDLKFLEIDNDKVENDSLWGTFLNTILIRRHDIAHGKETNNGVHFSIIEEDKVKVEILIYSFAIIICNQCNPVTPSIVGVEYME